jgi:hypothetical protein
MGKYALIALVVMAMSACGGSPTSPSTRDCDYFDTGTLVLVNLAETRTPRDVYVDGRFVDVVPYGNQVVLHPDAGVNHTVEWVSTLGGGTVDTVRVFIDTCATSRLTNYF